MCPRPRDLSGKLLVFRSQTIIETQIRPQDCQRKVLNNMCPTCRGPITGRNVAMEKLSDSYFGSLAFDECPDIQVQEPDTPSEPSTPEPVTPVAMLTTEL